MAEASRACPNCSAPLNLAVGQVDILCDYCDSLLKFVPSKEELEVVRTREQMKYRERVAKQRTILANQLKQQEAEKWRRTAANVAIQALPIVGTHAGHALFRAALGRSVSGCGGTGCGCLAILIGLVAALAWLRL